MKKVVAITGQTGIGKTDISLEIASIFDLEIINADASQFRRGLNIGTAKIDLKSTNIKHHLIDIIEISDNFSIKEFQGLGRKTIKEIIERGKLPLIVGGSGLYINALLRDYDLSSKGRNVALEDKYLDLTNLELHDLLKGINLETSKNIHPNNRRRVLRAIEVGQSAGSLSNKQADNLYDALIIVLHTKRELLYERINSRVDIMMDNAWIDEVKTLKSIGIDASIISDIGYSDIDSYLEGKLEYDEMSEVIKKKTRNFAKRQMTWFKNKMNAKFVMMDYDNIDTTINEINEMINIFLNEG